MQNEQEIIARAYIGFNTREIDAVLALLHPNVEWPNGWEGGYLSGRDSVRAYWTRQWKELNPHVAPENFSKLSDGRIEVQVAQVVKDISGNVVAEGHVKHIYSLEDGLISKMEIQ